MATRKKKTAEDYAADIKKAEARVAELKRKAAQATKAEQARHNAEVLKALREYWDASGRNWKTAPQTIHDWTRNVLQKRQQGQPQK